MSKLSLDELLKEIETRAENASTGPWVVVSDLPCYAIAAVPNYRVVQTQNQSNWKHRQNNGGIEQEVDADFIAHARTDVPKLLAVIRKLIEQRDSWAAEVSVVVGKYSYDTTHNNDELAKILEGEE